jgi:hypothetical protein
MLRQSHIEGSVTFATKIFSPIQNMLDSVIGVKRDAIKRITAI